MLPEIRDQRSKVIIFIAAVVGAGLLAAAPRPASLSIAGQYTIATTFFAALLWVTRALPLPVTALSIPALLTLFGVYDSLDPALYAFADPLIFLFIAGFMLANALQKHNIDRRIALRIIDRMGISPRLLLLSIMFATAFLSMWVSNTATTAMMLPIALGILAQVHSDKAGTDEPTNMQTATLLGTAYAASVGGVATLIGTPPNAVVVAAIDRLLGVDISFFDWLFIGLPVTVVTLPLVWYTLIRLYPPEVAEIDGARAEAARYLEQEGDLSTRARWVALIFVAAAALWILGGLDFLFVDMLPPRIHTTLFGGEGATLLGLRGHQGALHFVLVGLYTIPALVLADAVDWDDLEDIDWGTILLFGGGISLANAFAETGATAWAARTVFGAFIEVPLVLVVAVVIAFVITLTEVTSNTATTTIIAPLLIGVGSILASTIGVEQVTAAIFLSVAGAVAASFAFALPVSTPPNAIVFGSGHVEQRHMLRTGVILSVLMTGVLTAVVTLLFLFVWPIVLW